MENNVVLYFSTKGVYDSELIYQLSDNDFVINYSKDMEDFQNKIEKLQFDLIILDASNDLQLDIKKIKTQKGEDFPLAVLNCIPKNKVLFDKLKGVYFFDTENVVEQIQEFIANLFSKSKDIVVFENNFIYSLPDHAFYVSDKEISRLNPQESKLLEHLVSHKHSYQSYDSLQKYLAVKESLSVDSLRTIVKNIRKKSYPGIITNLSGVGYKVNLPKNEEKTKIKILICDDVKANVEFLKLLIVKNISDVEIFKALGGKDAIKILEKENINIALLDIQMPDVSGWDVAKYIQKDLYYKNIATIFITSVFTDDEFVKQGFKLGAVDYLTKPVDRNLLINRLKLYIKNFDQEKTIAKQMLKTKEQEKLLLQKEVLLAQSNVLEKIAHHWRQPLNIISLSASGIFMTLKNESTDIEKIKTAADLILKETGKLSHTIEEFQTFFAPQNEKAVLNIKDCIGSIVELLRYNFEQSDIQIDLNIADVNLLTYENALKRVLISVINNAIDILDQRVAENKIIKIDTQIIDDFFVINITDNGGGVDKAIESKIYEPYFSTKHHYSGTGLSLYFSLQIAQRYLKGTVKNENTDIRFKNKKYKGAKFSIYLKRFNDEN